MNNYLMDILIHNELYSDSMTDEQFAMWVNAHMIYLNKVNQITGEKHD